MNYNLIKKRYAACLKGRYAMGAFNFPTSDIARAIFLAAQKLRAPILLETSAGEMAHLTPEVARGIADGLNKIQPDVFILHLDHGHKLEDIQAAIKAGYDSVHCDASHLPFKKNLELTKKAAALAHKHGLWCEGELGHVGGSSTLHKDQGYDSLEIIKTDPDQAKEFVQRTGIDSLAANIGNVHGIWKGLPHIDFHLLEEIHKKVKVPLVLHGGSGIARFQIQKALDHGICKVNVNSEMRIAFSESIRQSLQDRTQFVPTKYLPLAIESVQKVVEKKILLFKSAGKLRKL